LNNAAEAVVLVVLMLGSRVKITFMGLMQQAGKWRNQLLERQRLCKLQRPQES
jgi:hypothetical protein